MPIFNVEAQNLTVADPYVIGSAPDNLTGWTQIANPLRVASATPQYFLGTNTANCIWISSTQSPVSVFYSRIVLDAFGSESQGCVACNLSGVGYEFLLNTTFGARLFAMTSGGVLGSQKGSSVATSASAGQVVELEVRVGDPSVGNVRLICRVNGVERINFTEANANTTWYGGGVIRGSGRARSIEFEYTSPQSINSITDPVVVGSNFTLTTTGYADGAASFALGSQTIPVTIASNSATALFPAFSDGMTLAFLPATGLTGTLTQSALSATISANIALPTDWDVTRDGSDVPANLSGIVTDDAKYIGYHFLAAGNALTTNDRFYWDKQTVSSKAIKIYQDGRVVVPAELMGSGTLTMDLWVHRGSDNKVYLHEMTVNAEGVVSVGGLTMRGLTLTGLRMTGLTMRGL